MTIGRWYKAQAYAVRDVETKERLSYRYTSLRELRDSLGDINARYGHTGRNVEIYRTTMDRPLACKPAKGRD